MSRERQEQIISPEKISIFTISQEFTDESYNHLHHTGYFKYLEEARLNVFKEQGFDIETLLNTYGLSVPVHEINAKYVSEVKAGDEVTVITKVNPRLARLIFDQRMERDGQTAMRALVTCAMVDVKTGRPQKIPDFIMKMFSPK